MLSGPDKLKEQHAARTNDRKTCRKAGSLGKL